MSKKTKFGQFFNLTIKSWFGVRFQQKRCTAGISSLKTPSGRTIFIFSNIIFGRIPNVSKTAKFFTFNKMRRSAKQKERGPDMAKTRIRGSFYQVSQMATKITRYQPMRLSLWGTIKQKVYNPRPAHIEELTENIKWEFEIYKKNW